MTKRVKYLIVGGGPTGLGAATRLVERGVEDWLLLEAEDGFGGLARSWVDAQGFTWDLGGHVVFSHYDRFDRTMDLALGRDGWFEHRRESWVRLLNAWVPYPFQENLHRLPPEARWRCVRGLLEVWKQAEADKAGRMRDEERTNFEGWIRGTFGAGIADTFMLPYNFKVWAYPPATMSSHWVGERVAVPELERVLHAVCTGQDQVSWGPNVTFRFPKHGGTGAIWRAVGAALPPERCLLNTGVKAIDPENKRVDTHDGRAWRYRHLLSTMPLNDLIRLSGGRVAPIAAADRLVYSSTHLVGLGMEGRPPAELESKCWIYFPEPNSPYYRVTVFTNYSPNNAPRPGRQWSLMAEVSESPAKTLAALRTHADAARILSARGVGREGGRLSDRAFVEQWTIGALVEDGLLPDPEAIVSVAYRHLPQGYPTPWMGRDAVVDPILRAFEGVDIYSRGRFGAWKYEVANQDHAFAQGCEWADAMLDGGGTEAEPTLHFPHRVNSRRNP